MGDENDTTARWVHLVCGFVFLLVAILFGWFAIQDWQNGVAYDSYSSYRNGGVDTICLGALYLAVRCLWYAITGKDNINRDDF